MKKLMIFLAVLTAAFTLRAADNDEIIQTITEFRLSVLSFDFEKAITYCTADYVEFSPDGKHRTIADLRQMMQAYRTMESSNDLEVVLECALKLQGTVMTDAQRQQIRAVKGTSREAQALAAIKQQLSALRTQMVNMRSVVINMLKIRDVRINGSDATATQEFIEPGTGKKYITYYKLRKVNGRWLICELRQETPA